jgi:hypothetical protein
MKIPPENPLDGVTLLGMRSMMVSVMVLVEPSDFALEFSPRIGSRDSLLS